jgi:radical SAM protein with 4Fe4S-binding SPASM domain
MIESMIESENQAFLDTFKYIGDEVKIEPVMNWNDPEEGVLANVSRDELLEKDYFKSKKSVCPFPFYTLVIHSDLKVSVCCVDWDKKTVIGDLSSNTLSEIWRGEQLKEFQLTHLRRRREELDGCNTCTYLHTAPDNLEGLTESQFLSRLEGASTAKEL